MPSKEKINKLKQSITIEQMFDLLTSLGGEPQEKDDIIVSRTICHNPPGEGSYKLYYYSNSQLFKCYTECENDGAFDIFALVSKVKKITENEEWSLYKSVYFVANYFGIYNYEDYNFATVNRVLRDWDKISDYERIQEIRNVKQVVELKKYDSKILKYLPRPNIIPWEKEGISREVIRGRKIAYDPINEGIIIPHYDIDNNLIGIRQRTLIKENEKYGKYTPARINGIMYNHPLSFNLYNLNNSKENIKIIKKAIVVESEKATMLYSSYFGKENDISVACCGSSLIGYQIHLLLSLGVQEIIVAFDRQYQEIGDKEFKRWTKKLTEINNKYCCYCTFSFVFDKYGYLDYKDSPIDKGKDIFLELYKRRIFL